ncbi:PKD domain-containing protein, partial [bacterium]|nr:PKD domain-containing protein [bacterium]
MSNQTVYDCIGTLSDSEANTQQAGWYDHNENFTFTICPNGAASIIIDFSFFNTEPINDYLLIYDGPNSSSPVLAGPFSGVSTPPQITSNGCVTLVFVSDLNVAADGFNLSWETIIDVPDPPALSLPITPTCSITTLNVQLDQNIHCDSVFTANINVGGQINQTVNAIPLSCINDSTDLIQLSLSPGINQSGSYNIYFQSFFKDVCDSIWSLSSSLSFDIIDCPISVDLYADNDTICLGDCTDLNISVAGGDASTYNYSWNPILPNNSGPHQVCPTVTTQYVVSVSDLGPANPQSDTLTVVVVPPTTTQADFSICNTANPVSLIGNPPGGWWSGGSINNGTNPLFDPTILSPGTYNLNYDINGCDDNLEITVLEIFAGNDISACVNAPTFNLNSSLTTPGGTWSGSTSIQSNGNIDVGPLTLVIDAIYTLPNGCSDTLVVNVVNSVNIPNNFSLCQNSQDTVVVATPSGGIWSSIATNPLIASSCINSIDNFPYVESFELGLSDWTNDPNNDFDWVTNINGTPSNNTGPSFAYDLNNYIYAETSNSNHPFKNTSIISPCINLSEYNNPVLNFFYHKYGNGNDNAILSVDISNDNGVTWQMDVFSVIGDLGDQWYEHSIDLTNFISSELKLRFRVLTGHTWSSDIAIDKVSILGGPITFDGTILSSVISSGNHDFQYSIQGCSDLINVNVQEIDAGDNFTVCPSQASFNLTATPLGGIWNGINVVNQNTGLYDPSTNLGIDLVTYSNNQCVDTVEVNVVNTELFEDTLFLCHNSSELFLGLNVLNREPYNGIFSGNGITNSNFPGVFSANNSGIGNHMVTYSANTCSDNLVFNVYPKPILLDTLICSNAYPFILSINVNGGQWNGSGIIDNSTGLFDPSIVPLGILFLEYISENGCIDTFQVEVIDPPNVSFASIDINYCFVDSFYNIAVLPSGGILSGSGVVNTSFNPSIAGSGYHNITYTYGSGNCISSVDTVFFVGDELLSSTFSSNDTICEGEIVNISVNVNGGTGNYQFNWNNNLSNSFNHLVSPTQTTNYIINISDGCSDDTFDTIPIFVFNSFDLSFVSSEKKCFGEFGFAKVSSNSLANIFYQWNTNPITNGDSIYALVNRNYVVTATDPSTDCNVIDTIRINGYDDLKSDFSLNNNECLSVLDATLQFIDLSIVNPNEINSNSFWDFGDGTSVPYIYSLNPSHTFIDTGQYKVSLFLINDGGCIDSSSLNVCVIPESKIFIPNSFSPNNDMCNDFFFVKALGLFFEFNIKIYDRWNTTLIFESNDIILTDDL